MQPLEAALGVNPNLTEAEIPPRQSVRSVGRFQDPCPSPRLWPAPIPRRAAPLVLVGAMQVAQQKPSGRPSTAFDQAVRLNPQSVEAHRRGLGQAYVPPWPERSIGRELPARPESSTE
jgi:hypothetical protein